MKGPVLEYKTIYGEQLTFDTSTREVPTINGHPVNYARKRSLKALSSTQTGTAVS